MTFGLEVLLECNSGIFPIGKIFRDLNTSNRNQEADSVSLKINDSAGKVSVDRSLQNPQIL